jgi:hypothetical protein
MVEFAMGVGSWLGLVGRAVYVALLSSLIFGGGSEDDSVQEGLANHQKLMPKSKNKFAQFSNTRFLHFTGKKYSLQSSPLDGHQELSGATTSTSTQPYPNPRRAAAERRAITDRCQTHRCQTLLIRHQQPFRLC